MHHGQRQAGDSSGTDGGELITGDGAVREGDAGEVQSQHLEKGAEAAQGCPGQIAGQGADRPGAVGLVACGEGGDKAAGGVLADLLGGAVEDVVRHCRDGMGPQDQFGAVHQWQGQAEPS